MLEILVAERCSPAGTATNGHFLALFNDHVEIAKDLDTTFFFFLGNLGCLGWRIAFANY